MNLKEYLESVEGNYSSKDRMLGLVHKSPGYHTNVPNGEWVHPTRDALGYAVALLEEGSPARVNRACDIIRKVISLQDQDTASPTYGIWSWLMEEPLDKMTPPDWNWADFCGLYLAEIYRIHGNLLPGALLRSIAISLDHAAASIFRRNMGPHYTNISIMGGIVMSLAGEILNAPRWLASGKRRLEKCVEHFEFHGGFNEYNSPTYTMVVLRDCERGLRLMSRGPAKQLTKRLWRAAWETIAEHYHAPTHQWAGPHSRSYHTFLSPQIARWLSQRTRIAIPVHPWEGATVAASETPEDAFAHDCPADLRSCFAKPPAKIFEIKRRFIRRSNDETSTWGLTWFSKEACLGSVNRDIIWDQRRAVQAYWIGAGGTPVSMRLRFLHDGREFASCYVFNKQVGSKVLSALHLLLDRGDFHPMWGAPEANIFQAEDFRVRYEFIGPGLNAKLLKDGRYVVASGKCQAVITPAPC
ncbi:MAG: hypothetical protein WCD79_17660, partial [Chthoniobacteraceae bacterium]